MSHLESSVHFSSTGFPHTRRIIKQGGQTTNVKYSPVFDKIHDLQVAFKKFLRISHKTWENIDGKWANKAHRKREL